MRICLWVLTIVVAGSTAAATNAQSGVDLDAFLGTWKEDTAKTQKSIPTTFTYTFSQDADGFVTIVRANTPVRDRVRFDGKDYETPGIPGRTVSWTKVGDTVYETAIKRDGALLANGRWTVSDGGQRLTQETTPIRQDGQSGTDVIEYVRVSGKGDSLLGLWKPVSSRTALADLFVVTRVDDAALKVLYPRNQSSFVIRPDGKPYAPSGANVLPDMTTATDAIGPRAVRRTSFRGQTPTLETVMTVSADGTILTVTTRTPGSSGEPAVFIYEKQR